MSGKKEVWIISRINQQIVDQTKFNLEMRYVSPTLGVGGPYHTITIQRKQLQKIMGNFGVSRWEDLVQETFVSTDTSDKGLLHSLLGHRITFNIMSDSVSLTNLVTSIALSLYGQINFDAKNDLIKTLHLEDFIHLVDIDQTQLHKLYISLVEAQADFLYRLEPIVGRFLTPNQSSIVANALWLFNEDFGGSDDLINIERNWIDHDKYLNLKK